MATVGELRGPRVPPELLHIIFEHADKPSLLSCMCTCRDWLELARPYLFDKVVWRLRPEHFRWGMKEDPEGLEHPLGLECLLDYLQHHPDVCPFIHDLTLGLLELPFDVRWQHILDRPDPRYASFDTLSEILNLLPSLHTFQVDRIPFRTLPLGQNTSADAPIPLRKLKILSWMDSHNVDSSEQYGTELLPACAPDTFYGFLGRFSEIDEVSLGTEMFLWPVLPAWAPAAPNAMVRSLVLANTDPEIANGLSLLQDIAHLTLPAPSRKGTPMACRLLTQFGLSLRNITLSLSSPEHIYIVHGARFDYASIAAPLAPAVAALRALDTLEIRMTVHGKLFANARLWERACFHQPTYDFAVDLLRVLPRATQRVTFRLTFERKPAFPHRPVCGPLAEDWSTLDDALAERVERGLRTIEFVEDRDGGLLSNKKRDILKKRLPRTWASGA
ncbi:F-box protein [Phanerochaete sordida]|uniref:F-box protein n=1 Tax=Phanerochaete sordida TaxID=48140 RepID=A0A9P3L9S9_9APHY|nr:F-box protein [Phanerochaete sordida]